MNRFALYRKSSLYIYKTLIYISIIIVICKRTEKRYSLTPYFADDHPAIMQCYMCHSAYSNSCFYVTMSMNVFMLWKGEQEKERECLFSDSHIIGKLNHQSLGNNSLWHMYSYSHPCSLLDSHFVGNGCSYILALTLQPFYKLMRISDKTATKLLLRRFSAQNESCTHTHTNRKKTIRHIDRY